MNYFKTGASFFLLLLSSYSFSGVNLKNGNFHISYTDIVVPGGGKKLEITSKDTLGNSVLEFGYLDFC